MFDKRIIGVSGVKNDDPRLVEAMKQFKIYANKIYRKKEDEGTKNYMIDHTALGFLMDHNNELVMIIGPNLNGEQIAKGIFDDAIETNNLETHTIKDAH
jgi:cytochrome oxidase Cu insertion factor (SCO1/SenC/PrrC family)